MKTVEFHTCECSGKRGFADVRAAEKALGRAQAKRDRTAERRGQRRAIDRENRIYQCDFGMWHLTKQSRRSFEELGTYRAA
ncbi:hypothetical protein ACFQ64_04585 [Streptomyces sp. NPDC056460]|uniref:hypothetical protein n=1 Tax=Streptomyces sp. NPDC056460 TaxID=3345825 RepID=UPI003674E4E5